MSTKNLARTVIEGGRTSASKWIRRQSLKLMRVRTRVACKKLLSDLELLGDLNWPWRERTWDDIEHADRTNPCDRFLASRAGRQWNDVRSEITTRFRRRSLPGRHVVDKYLLNRVYRPDDVEFYLWWSERFGPRFWVDESGVLRHNPSRRW